MDQSTKEKCTRELLDAIESLLTSGAYSDLKICTPEREYHVHQAVVCTRSHFFRSACDLGFKEKDTKEIHLPDDCPRCVDCMILYFYTLDYHNVTVQADPVVKDDISTGTAELSLESSSSYLFDSLSLHARVYALAEKYNIQGLKDVARVKFSKELKRTGVENHLLSIIEEVYTSTPAEDRGLRDPLVDVVYNDIQYWTTQDNFLDGIDRYKEFYSDILRSTVAKDLQKLGSAVSIVKDHGQCAVCHERLLLRQYRSRKNNVTLEKYCARCGVNTLTQVL